MEDLKNALSYAISKVNLVREITGPLNQYFGISNFGYLKIIYKSYDYFYLCNDQNLLTDYIQNVKDTVIFCKEIMPCSIENNKFHHVTWPDFPSHYSMEIYIKHGYWNGLTFMRYNEDSVELWWFASQKDNLNIHSFYKRNIGILEKFIHYFNAQIGSVLDLKDPQYLSRYIHGVDDINILKCNTSDIAEQLKIKQFLDAIHQQSLKINTSNGIVQLTPREIECLKALSEGNTAKDIGKLLNISNRSIEKYFENIKTKTGSGFRKDLIDLYNTKIHQLY